MRCAFSVPPLQALLQAEMVPSCVVIPGSSGAPPVEEILSVPIHGLPMMPIATSTPSIVSIAHGADIPIIAANGLKSLELRELLEGFTPDLIVTACFPWRLPAAILDLPRYGCLNVHPSLLPRWRGPEPLLWTFLADDPITGTTIHLMDKEFDTGPILLQETLPVDDGVNGAALEQRLAELGGELLVQAVPGQMNGSLFPIAQHQSAVRHARPPVDEDLVFTNQLPAQRIINLVRGIAPIWGPVAIDVVEDGVRFTVLDAFDAGFAPTVSDFRRNPGELITIPCLDGELTLRRASLAEVSPLTLHTGI
jgi:methionyl-tRNA formyltransferase